MTTFNKIILVGHLGRDPELRYTPQGTAVCDFSLATSERRKDGEESKEETTWFKVTLWARQAEVASQYLKKGRLVYIEGRLRAREWTDKDGRLRTSLEVQGSELHMLGSGSEDKNNNFEHHQTQAPVREAVTDNNDTVAQPPAHTQQKAQPETASKQTSKKEGKRVDQRVA